MTADQWTNSSALGPLQDEKKSRKKLRNVPGRSAQPERDKDQAHVGQRRGCGSAERRRGDDSMLHVCGATQGPSGTAGYCIPVLCRTKFLNVRRGEKEERTNGRGGNRVPRIPAEGGRHSTGSLGQGQTRPGSDRDTWCRRPGCVQRGWAWQHVLLGRRRQAPHQVLSALSHAAGLLQAAQERSDASYSRVDSFGKPLLAAMTPRPTWRNPTFVPGKGVASTSPTHSRAGLDFRQSARTVHRGEGGEEGGEAGDEGSRCIKWA